MKILNRMMDKIWQISGSVGATRTLAGVSFAESIFFPVPPDLLLIPMVLADRKRAFKLAAICLVANIFGAAVGYFIGKFFMEVVGMAIINFYGLQEPFIQIQTWYEEYSALAVAVAALTPIPYKLCTITAGAFEINFVVFILLSILCRGARFFAIAGLLYLFGDKVRYFLEKRLDLILLGGMLLVVAGFVLIKVIPW